MEGQKLLKEDMSSLKNVVETNHNKTDNQLKQLINYNKNRDNDLESVISGRFLQKLQQEGWSVSKLNFHQVYDHAGTNLFGFDSVMFAAHVNQSNPILFFGETKQLFTRSKLIGFYCRLERMQREVLPFLSMNGATVCNQHLRMAREINKVAYNKNPYVVKAFVGGAYIEPGVLEELKTNQNTSYVMSDQRLYEAFLLGF